MRYIYNHDLHIHSVLSSCCSDKTQTSEAHLQYARENGLSVICITDHFWDSDRVPGASKWYQPQNYSHIRESLPLPKEKNIKYLFGCETDMDKFMTLGISDKVIDELDFIIVPTTHLHMDNFTIDEKDFSFERRADVYVKRFEHLLSLDLPFHKIGIAHLTCPLISPARNGNPSYYKEVLSLISNDTFKELFLSAAKKGLGIELNFSAESMDPETLEQNIRPFRIARECGCKFYLGSDSHSAEGFKNTKKRFDIIVSALELTEDDKFDLLSIGNSFSQDSHRYLHELALSQGIELETVNLYIGGCPLERHYNNILSDAHDYLLEINGYSSEKYVSISETLKIHDWNFITLQQVSGFSGIPQSYFPYLTEVAEYIKKNCPKSELMFHQTWAYEKTSTHEHFVFYNRDQHEMFRRLKDCSEMAAKILDVDIIRVGEAIQNLRDSVKEFEYSAGGISLNRDGFHLSLDYGRFAAAAVWFKKLIGISDIDVYKFTKSHPDYSFDTSLLETIIRNI